MPTALIPSQTAAGNGSVTVAGAPVTVSINATGNALPNPTNGDLATIELQSSAGTFIRQGGLTVEVSAIVLQGDGIYRISKPATSIAYGVDRS